MSLPIRKITLYNNGYATFQREGEYEGNANIDLYFRQQDMADVLKSISFNTEGSESKICSVSYQNTKQETSDLSINIPERTSLTGLLTSLKGVKVSLSINTGKTVEGILLGIESLPDPNFNGQPTTIVTLFQGLGVKSYPLWNLTGIDFLDENIQHEMQYSLKAELSQKNRDMLRVTVFTQGVGKYKVIVNYSLMASEWKPSYRLELNDKESEQGVCSAQLDVFAIVHNTQEEDWIKVNMDIVSGVPPIPKGNSDESSCGNGSFPVTVKLLNSRVFTIRCDASDTVEVVKKRIRDSQGFAIAQQRLIFNGKQIDTGRTMSDYNIRANSVLHLSLNDGIHQDSDTTGTKPVFRLAEKQNLSLYQIDTPITALRSQSALVPILHSDIDVTKVLLYNEDMRNGNPLSCVMFSNSTGYTLEQGTLALKQGSVTLGECSMEQMWPKDEEMYPYAVQLSVEVSVETNTDRSKPHLLKIANGEISVYAYKHQTSVYTFDNKCESKFPTIFLDHSFLDGWELNKGDDKPIDITDRYYRFELSLGPKEKTKFEVPEKVVDITSHNVEHISLETVDKWHETEVIDNVIHKDLMDIVDLNKAISSLGSKIYDIETEMREAKDTSERLRKNISVVTDFKAQNKYVEELANEEDNLKQLEKTRKRLNEEKRDLNKKLSLKAKSMSYSLDLDKSNQ